MFRLKRSSLVCFLLLIPIFQPIYLEVVLSPIKIYLLLALAGLAYAVFEVIGRREKISTISIVMILYVCTLMFSTILGKGYFQGALIYAIRISLLVLIFEMYSDKIGVLLKSLMVHSEICVYLNFLTILIAPDGFFSRNNSAYGMTQEWFLGADNAFAMWLVPALIISWIYNEYFKNKARCVLLTIVVVITEIIQGSATGIVGVVLFLILILFPFIKQLFTPIKGILLAGAAFSTIVLFRNVDFLEPIMEFLGKDVTFTGRVVIWDNAIKSISNNPILGYGVLVNDEMISYLGKMRFGIAEGATHCHCQFLQVAFQGGMVACVLFALVYVFAIRENRKVWQYRISRYGVYGLIVYTVMGITEVLDNPLMLLLFPLSYYVSKTKCSMDEFPKEHSPKVIYNRVWRSKE